MASLYMYFLIVIFEIYFLISYLFKSEMNPTIEIEIRITSIL